MTPTNPDRKIIGVRACFLQLVVMLALAFLIAALFGPKPLLAATEAGGSVARQVSWGVAIGLAISVPAWIVVLNLQSLTAFKSQMLELANRIDLRGLNPLWIGLCAGVGEEVLCRGALQPLLGIWWTSLLFTLAHYRTGSFRSMNRTKWGYAGLVFLASMLMGYVLIEFGLVAAAVSHSVVDVIGIVVLRSESGRNMPRTV